jgi:hypothetical protein
VGPDSVAVQGFLLGTLAANFVPWSVFDASASTILGSSNAFHLC